MSATYELSFRYRRFWWLPSLWWLTNPRVTYTKVTTWDDAYGQAEKLRGAGVIDVWVKRV